VHYYWWWDLSPQTAVAAHLPSARLLPLWPLTVYRDGLIWDQFSTTILGRIMRRRPVSPHAVVPVTVDDAAQYHPKVIIAIGRQSGGTMMPTAFVLFWRAPVEKNGGL
jgi:hypothetical protein